MLRSISCSGGLLFVALLLTGWAVAQEGAASPSRVHEPKTAATEALSNPCPDSSAQRAMKEDMQRMRAILNQMRTNLAFVGNNTSPLNHQLELEIEMWQTLLNRMEGRLTQPDTQKPGR